MAESALIQNRSTLQIGTLADWGLDAHVRKMQNQMRKALKRSLKTQSIRNNRINTFSVTSVELKEVPELHKRLKAEEKITKILHDYSNRVNAAHQKAIKYNGDTKVYLKAFKALKIDLEDQIVRVQHEYIDMVETKIREIVTSSYVTVWTVASEEPDKLIIGDLSAEVMTKQDQKLDEMIDELLITNLGKQFLPFTAKLLESVFESLKSLNGIDKLTISENDHLSRIIYQVIGTISGLQESLKLLVRQVSHLDKMVEENISELREFDSVQLHRWIKSFETMSISEVVERISQIDNLVSAYKKQLRNLKRVSGNSNGRLLDLNGTMEIFIDLRAKISGLRHWINRFESIPNFTSLNDGIAYEQVEDEKYEVKSSDNLLEATKIFKNYYRGGSTIYALRGIDLELTEGEFVIVKGPSGSGKTTLLNILAGLESVDRGTIFFKGDELVRMKDRKKSKIRRENFSFIFQNYALIPHLTAYENVKVPLDLSGLSKELQAEIQSLLESVGIGPYAEHKPALLSGGQMQRLAIARALISRPKVIFADEPTGDLDRQTSLVIMDLLKKYHEETGVTIILVTHDDEIAKYGSRIIKVKDGRLDT